MSKQLLVIAEEEEVLDFVQAIFEREGYQVQTSPTHLDLQQESGPSPDLILLDVLVNATVGRAVTQQWQKQSLSAPLPLLLFSARLPTSQVLPGSHLVVFSAQPCHIRPLLETVEHYTSSSLVPSAAFGAEGGGALSPHPSLTRYDTPLSLCKNVWRTQRQKVRHSFLHRE
jgi:two-component system, OmpR family, response regulator VicR